MNETVLRVSGLSKQYGQLRALDSVNMEIRRGEIYGFVGENGAGKTTLIRILAGLCFQNGGEVELLGKNSQAEIAQMRRRVGAIVENPVLFPEMTAAQNLEICRLQRNVKDKSLIKKALRTVNLTETGKKKAKHFSLGMKQRLGLAMALLAEPEFMILDEPVNGLDPVGIVEFRELIKKLNHEQGITILISSHILSELYQLATCYGFIHKGRMLEQISLDQLGEKCRRHLRIVTDDAGRAGELIKQSFTAVTTEVSDGVLKVYDPPERTSEVTKMLVGAGIAVEGIGAEGDDLEGYYMSLIGGRK